MTTDGLTTAFPGAAGWRGRHVVVCNWRDGRHPQAGGAEVYCQEVAEQLRRAGMRLTYLTARPPGAERTSATGHGTVRRGGGRFTVYFFVLFWLWRHRHSVDAVIDSQNGIPFFSPLVLPRRTPVVLLVHHVHQNQFGLALPRPLACLGRLLEAGATRLVYGERVICTVSPSSRAEIRSLLGLRGPIHLAPPGLSPAGPPPRRRAPVPRIVCAGRLVRHKRLEHVVRAVAELAPGLPVELHIIGDGPARRDLERLAAELKLHRTVVFHGRLPGAERDRLLGSAWVTATASRREGWGLTVMEAAAAGVPTVAYDVPGLRDTVRHGSTGWLLASGESMAGGLARALHAVRTPARAADWERTCRAWARRFTWSGTGAHLLAALTTEEARLDRPGPAPRPAATDAATLVTLPHSALAAADLTKLRATDLVDTTGPGAALLLAGADEHDAAVLLRRAGVDVVQHRAGLRPARWQDSLGWQQHAPCGPTARPGHPARRRRSRWWAPALALLFSLALALRLTAIEGSYEVLHDELYYATIGHNLAQGDGLTFQGREFSLHPPALFATLAAAVRLGAAGQPDMLQATLSLRWVIAVTGSLLVIAVTALLRRAVHTTVALAAGLLLALDPFLHRFDSRVMMEAQATAAAAAGMLLLARAPASRPARTAVACAAGLLFALSVTTKESYALITVVPVLLAGLWTKGRLRRMRLAAAATAAAGYALYPAAVAATGGWPAWWQEKREGLARATGLHQISGFNSPTGPDLGDRLAANLGQYTVSYTLIALGAASALWLLWHRLRAPGLFSATSGRGLITAWSCCAAAALLYAITWGTLEEQMFYPLLVTSTTALALALDLVARRVRAAPRLRHGQRVRLLGLAAAVLVAALLADHATWSHVHTRRDDAYRRTAAWMRSHLPEHAAVAATDETSALVIPNGRLKHWHSLQALERHGISYVLVSTTLAESGYARIDAGLYTALDRHAPVVHAEPGDTTGTLRVHDVRPFVCPGHRASACEERTGGEGG